MAYIKIAGNEPNFQQCVWNCRNKALVTLDNCTVQNSNLKHFEQVLLVWIGGDNQPDTSVHSVTKLTRVDVQIKHPSLECTMVIRGGAGNLRAAVSYHHGCVAEIYKATRMKVSTLIWAIDDFLNMSAVRDDRQRWKTLWDLSGHLSILNERGYPVAEMLSALGNTFLLANDADLIWPSISSVVNVDGQLTLTFHEGNALTIRYDAVDNAFILTSECMMISAVIKTMVFADSVNELVTFEPAAIRLSRRLAILRDRMSR